MDPFIGEIRMFAGNFAPRGYALCDGQLLAVSQNDALFSLLGTIYGGDGRTTFGLPDLRGRIPIHKGSGPGLTTRPIGQKSGQENVTVHQNQLPAHHHGLQASTGIASSPNPAGNVLGRSNTVSLYQSETPNMPMNADTVTTVGGSQSHANVQPFQCINYIIALVGVYPSRT
jgi:microcystin-dependent protein